VIYGRCEERALIADLLAGAREGHSGVLVIRGEAGIGKHTLLQDAARQAGDFHLLRAAGIESEMGLPFAALHQLLQPVLDRVDRLPILQAVALRGAFGLLDTDSRPSRFLTAADKLPAKGKELVMRIGEDQQEFEILPEEDPPVVVPEPEPPRQPEDTPA
jgi:hypothetical protein